MPSRFLVIALVCGLAGCSSVTFERPVLRPPQYVPKGPVKLVLNGVKFHAFQRGMLVGSVPEEGAIEKWKALTSEAKKLGRWPVLVNDGQLLERIDPKTPTPKTFLKLAEELTIDGWRSEHERRGARLDKLPALDERSINRAAKNLELDGTVKGLDSLGRDSMRGVGGQVVVVLLPTPDSWKAHAFLPNGTWNGYAAPEESIAVLRSWHDRFGTEVVSMTHDELALELPQEVKELKTLRSVVWEQILFCPDTVDGAESVIELAAVLRRSRVWQFWWD